MDVYDGFCLWYVNKSLILGLFPVKNKSVSSLIFLGGWREREVKAVLTCFSIGCTKTCG